MRFFDLPAAISDDFLSFGHLFLATAAAVTLLAACPSARALTIWHRCARSKGRSIRNVQGIKKSPERLGLFYCMVPTVNMLFDFSHW